MKIKPFILFILTVQICSAQVENVPLEHPVYNYLKEMKVKHIIGFIHEDSPNLARLEVKNFLTEIKNNFEKLSVTEKDLLIKFETEFFEDDITKEKYWQMFNYENGFTDNLGEFGKDKIKYLYAYKDKNVNAFFEGTAHIIFGQSFYPRKTNAELYDIGFSFRGTLL